MVDNKTAAGKIKIITVSGFLGSGKTSFLNHLIKKLSGSRVGLLINDFGSIPVDYELVKTRSAELSGGQAPLMINIENGSIFCCCRKTAFLEGLDYFFKEKPEYLVIETSGISDPGSLSELIALDRYAGIYSLLSLVCLVDAGTFMEMRGRFLFIERQLDAADQIILNKTDLKDNTQLKQLEAELRKTNSRARIIRASYGEADIDLSFGTKPGPEISRAEETCKSEEPDKPASRKPLSVSLADGEIATAFLNEHDADLRNLLIRIKGYLSENGKTYKVNGTAGGIDISEVSWKPEHTGLTLIFDVDNQQAVTGLLEKIN